jgi:hypothetical protein|tara:strand:+ start:3053 stop:5224 length:2172 start_codon:yes stop_codon:yes gene_type:complete
MPLRNIQIRPGFNKQVTEVGAEGQWTDGDFVRFRYGLPEKIGGWEQLTTSTLVGNARAQHVWADLDGRAYSAIGTHKGLFVYYGGAFYDITPLDSAKTGATFTVASTSAPQTITVNLNGHGLVAGDLFTFTSVTVPTGSGYATSVFEDNPFQVLTATSNTFTIEVATAASGTTTGTGAATVNPYVNFGPLTQTFGFGWGTGQWAGTVAGATTTTLNGALADDTNGNNGSATNITLTSTTGFPTSGTILVGSELISYSGVSSNDLTGISRAVSGSTRSSHSNGAQVQDASNFIGWGNASSTSTITLDPASWSLDNFGEVLIATNKNGKTFNWEPIHSNANALNTRAVAVTNAPTQSVMSIVSERDRHLILLGTDTSLSSPSQDKMFIRFSDQEDRTTYAPTSTNTAGTFRLDSGTKIVGAAKGKDYILILTDTSAYVMQFVGPPFTFSIRQVGSNCGLIGQHALYYINGAVYWMSRSGGFFVFDGTVKSLPCLVEDFVFTTLGDSLGINYNSGEIVSAGVNNLFSEINWFYPKNGSTKIDRVVTYNYDEQTWTTGSLARTTWYDATLFDNPYATEFNDTATPTFPTIVGGTNINGATTYYAHEIGTNQVDASGNKTAINAFIQSGDFDLNVSGADGEFFMSMRRFIPDFKAITGDAKISILLKNFPVDDEASSPLGPFTITSATQKVDTRARARFASLKVENTSTDQSWRYGTFRADVQPDGMR